MNDIEQFKYLLQGNTSAVNTDAVVQHKSTPNYNRWTGIVVNNNDPMSAGRLQVKIYGYYDDLATTNIPWAIPEISDFVGTKGSFVIPELNCILRGYFDNGDEMKPIYDSLAFNTEYTSPTADLLNWWNRCEDYPNTVVLMQTERGDTVIMNKKTGEMTFTHHTGAVTMIDGGGNISINTGIVGASSAGVGNLTVNVSGANCNINAFGTIGISAMGPVNINSTTGPITLGNNKTPMLVNNLPVCPILGCPLAQGNTQVLV